MKYSKQILKNKNLFKTCKYASPNALNIKYFWIHPQLQQLGLEGGGVGMIILYIQSLPSRKRYA